MAPQPDPKAGVNPELVAEIKKQLQAGNAKPKLVTNADQFGSDEDAGKPFMSCEMRVIDGRIAILLPEDLPYSLTRDTSSRNRRLLVCKLDDPNGVEWELSHGDKAIPVKISLSSTLNVSAQAIKV